MREVEVLSGEQEAHFAALGVVAGIPEFAGIVGDLGGGSLELSSIAGGHDAIGRDARTRRHPAAGRFRPRPVSARASWRASGWQQSALLKRKPGGQFCAIGGTWRSLAKMHQVLRDYPLHMVQHYVAKASDLAKLCEEIVDAAAAGKPMPGADSVSSSRRDLVPYGAAVLGEVLRAGQVRQRRVLGARRARGLPLRPAAARRAGGRPAAAGGRGNLDPALALAGARRRSHRLHRASS